ncbi:MAG: integrin alpha, partial [Ignavibacteria bacterium]|nr:integrin alpha [Ignavibacteria bacterium]
MKSIINISIKERTMQFFFIVVLFAFQVVNPQRKQIFEEDAVQVAQQYMPEVEGNGSCQTAAISSRIFTGQAEGDQFGFSVSPAGDVNGDGFADVIIGAASNDAGGSNAGRAYLYFGSLIINSVPDRVFTGANIDDNLGYSVSTAGDVNGDGYDDIIIGS